MTRPEWLDEWLNSRLDAGVKVPEDQRELAAYFRDLEAEQHCTHCGGPETTDKDCMCGGSGMRSVQILGLEGCIQYWRDKHLKLLIENSALKRDERHAWDYLAKACDHDPKAHDSSGFHNAVTVFGFAQHVVRERDALRKQRDELLEALGILAAWPPSYPCNENISRMRQFAHDKAESATGPSVRSGVESQ